MDQQRPQETLRQLYAIFPPFEGWWSKEQAPPEDGVVDGVYYEWTHHSVMRQFLEYFSHHRDEFTEKQLQQFGAWVRDAISNPGSVENAVSTCFLEHMRQVRINRMLAPYLSEQTSRRS